MNPAEAKRLVVASLVVTGLVAAGGAFANGKVPSPKIGFGLLFAGTVLAVGAEVSPEVAGSFAVLLLATSVFVWGGPAFAAYSRWLGGPNLGQPAPGGTRPTRAANAGAGSGL